MPALLAAIRRTRTIIQDYIAFGSGGRSSAKPCADGRIHEVNGSMHEISLSEVTSHESDTRRAARIRLRIGLRKAIRKRLSLKRLVGHARREVSARATVAARARL